jgi:hypothetical protein
MLESGYFLRRGARMATDVRLWRKSRELWMKKNDRTAYDYWRRVLKPALGRSLARTNDAIDALDHRISPKRKREIENLVSAIYEARRKHRKFIAPPTVPAREIDRRTKAALDKIHNDMNGRTSVPHAHITFGFLRHLALEHRRKILRRRAAN